MVLLPDYQLACVLMLNSDIKLSLFHVVSNNVSLNTLNVPMNALMHSYFDQSLMKST
jgi:hypothetical protein